MLFPILRLLILGLCFIPIASIANTPSTSTEQAHTQLVQAYGKLPLSFEANQGQTDKAVQFISRGSGYGLYLTPTEAVLALSKPIPEDTKPTSKQKNPQEQHTNSTVRMQLLGANPAPKTSGVDELPGKVNYLRGNDPKQWRTNVATYGKVKYEQVYPGIDLVYYGNQRQLEYDFVVAPGADPNNIQLSFVGQTDKDKLQPRINKDGALVVGEVEIKKPVLYQDIAGQHKPVDGQFIVKANQQIGFQVAAYDKTKTLVIDPVLVYSTYLGSNYIDNSNGIAVDAQGQAYVTGETRSTSFPLAKPLQAKYAGGNDYRGDVFISKLSADGSHLLYSTYLGGSGGDWGNGIAVDKQGQAYVTGFTESSDFPLANPLQAKYAGGNYYRGDVFISKLSTDGSHLLYSTYLGGKGDEWGAVIAVDAQGQAYVTGSTESSDFPLVNSLQSKHSDTDVFISKLSADGHCLLYSTYLGGNSPDFGEAIAVDAQGQAYVTGRTGSPDFPLANPLQAEFGDSQDVFISKLSADGHRLLYSTYLGGKDDDYSGGIAVDQKGQAYVTGSTVSSDFPLVNALQAKHGGGNFDAFISKLNADGCRLLYSTYLGGSDSDFADGIAVDQKGQAYVIGTTVSFYDFPLVNPLQTKGDYYDVFISKLSANGHRLTYSTYLGGDEVDEGIAIAVDRQGNAYITGGTASSNFPLKNPLQANYGDNSDGFIAKIASNDYGLSVIRQGKEGVVSSQPNGISCGKIGNSVCTKFFPANSKVTLKATAGKNSVFVNWAGACAGSKALTCQVVMTGRKHVAAVFKAK